MNSLQKATKIIGGHVFGPFREKGGLPGEQSQFRMEAAGRAYQYYRYALNNPASVALAKSIPVALRPHNDRRARLWYGPRGGVGQVFKERRESIRWIDDTEAAGLRFVGWADELYRGIDHKGWYCAAGDFGDCMALRGGVWQVTGKKGRARLVYGYAEFEGRKEVNPGNAAICVSDITESDDCRAWESIKDLPEIIEVARFADSLAESVAEDMREYDEAYQLGLEAAERDNEAIEYRGELLAILKESRLLRKAPSFGIAYGSSGQDAPALRQAICGKVQSLLDDIDQARADRDNNWADIWSGAVPAWRNGFIDASDGGFLRAVRLGYAKATDWHGPPDANPCGVVA